MKGRICVLFLALAGVAQAQIIAQTSFDAGRDGWVGDHCNGGFSWSETGGNGGGYLRWREPCSALFAVSDLRFGGDWSGYVGRTKLWFDYKINAVPQDGAANDYEIQVHNPEGDLMIWKSPNPGTITDWARLSVDVRPENFIVLAGTFESIIANVESVRVRVRMFQNTVPEGDIGIDNVTLEYNPVPEPGTWAALGLGLLAIRRRGKS